MSDKKFEPDFLYEANAVASTTECTGLMSIPPTNEDEAEAYCEIYSVPPQVNDLDKVKIPKNHIIKKAPKR